MLDSMLLLNEEQVSAALRSQLYALAASRHGRRKRVALYAEREFGGAPAFTVESIPDAAGRLRRRSIGRKGPAPVSPVRGSGRVGSEGLVAFVISQAHATKPRSFMNHPGPDLIRGKTSPAGSIGIVTDFIGSGSRVCEMLDAFWAVPSVRSWVSRKWINFKVIAAAATAAGVAKVKRHRLGPEVLFQHAAPTISSHPDFVQADEWSALIERYGPDAGRGASRYGFGGDAALVAFNYRLPNNTPALVHRTHEGWRALYDGAAPDDLRPAFGVRAPSEVIGQAAQMTGVAISDDLSPEAAATILVLSLLRGRWHAKSQVALAERTGMAVPDIMDILARALKGGLVNGSGRLTDSGQALLAAGRRSERKRPVVATDSQPYYPLALRTSRGSSSTRRPSGRP
ncbi:phosphoribosyltransferase-like protein [Bradyrhizobium tunisiense]|uniref:phosphoribosyltransferase-like protein n=1 Tax=Bradyrhizobium tunisiense TaxID=3278709 RepID=UPI003D9C4089